MTRTTTAVAYSSLALLLLGCEHDRAPAAPIGIPIETLAPTADQGDDGSGWIFVPTIVRASSPNLLVAGGVFTGARGQGILVRLAVGRDGITLIERRETASGWASLARTAWPASRADDRVTLTIDQPGASDLALLSGLSGAVVAACTDLTQSRTTLVPGSVVADAQQLSWHETIVLSGVSDDPACRPLYSLSGHKAVDATPITIELAMSFVRARPLRDAPPVLVIPPEDPIRAKYGVEETDTMVPRVTRLDPRARHVFVLAKGLPEAITSALRSPTGVIAQTNDALAAAGVEARIAVRDATEADSGAPGDLRTSFVRWVPDPNTLPLHQAVVSNVVDPRTGEIVSSSILINEAHARATARARLDAVLAATSAPWPSGACAPGSATPLASAALFANHGGASPLYARMQAILGKPISIAGALGPHDLVGPPNAAPNRALRAIAPYEGARTRGKVRPDTIDVVALTRGARDLDGVLAPLLLGESPYGAAATPGLAALRYPPKVDEAAASPLPTLLAEVSRKPFVDAPEAFAIDGLFATDTVRCGADGEWESRDEHAARLADASLAFTLWHAFGHALGLPDDLLGSLDAPHFAPGLASSTVMEHGALADPASFAGYGVHDRAALAFLYGNTTRSADAALAGYSGQIDGNRPWRDPFGFDANGELRFLYCERRGVGLCRAGDRGTTPSEIIANDVEAYELAWARRAAGTWSDAWSSQTPETDALVRLWDARRMAPVATEWEGTAAPVLAAHGEALTAGDATAMRLDALDALRLTGALHLAIAQMTGDERPLVGPSAAPHAGVLTDKVAALTGWNALVPAPDLDGAMSEGVYSACIAPNEAGFASFARDVTVPMLAGPITGPTWLDALPAAAFVSATHSPSFPGASSLRDLISANCFDDLDSARSFFRQLAVKAGTCANNSSCSYDAVAAADSKGHFVGPDQKDYVLAAYADSWLVAESDRGAAAYAIVTALRDAGASDEAAAATAARAEVLLELCRERPKPNGTY